MKIHEYILQQLGGNKFLSMTGSYNLFHDETSLSMHLRKNNLGAKYLQIELKSDDTYTMTFSKIHNGELKILKKLIDVYFDQLQQAFTTQTGLLTKL